MSDTVTLPRVSKALKAAEAHGREVIAMAEIGAPSLAAIDGLRIDADRCQSLAVRWATAESRAPSGVRKARRLSLRASRLRTLALRLRPEAAQRAALARLGRVSGTPML